MKVLAVGGGSGGHVTPVVAVLREIRKLQPNSDIRFWCDKKFYHQASDIMAEFDKSVIVQKIIAGKLRRYHKIHFIRQLFIPGLVLSNFIDGLKVLIGLVQSISMLILWRPDVIFTKGGYVCLPVGLAAGLLRIPIVVHDSDAHPGLTNRILSRRALLIATGVPVEYYPYPKSKTKYVGIPVGQEFHRFSPEERLSAKKEWGINESRPLIVITGGGLGAGRINDASVAVLKDLMQLATVVLLSGTAQYEDIKSKVPNNSPDFQLHAFVSHDIVKLLGAADVVVARAGATTILELAALAKPTILIPNAHLTGGHQLKNAKMYQDNDAVLVLHEDELQQNPSLLVDTVSEVLINPDLATRLGTNLSKFARPDAAKDVAKMIIEAARV